MGGQTVSSHYRLPIAAGLFAIAAIALFLLVWWWPRLFGVDGTQESPYEEELSYEEKINVLNQLDLSNQEESVPVDERTEVLESVSRSSSNSEEDREERLRIIQSLNAQ